MNAAKATEQKPTKLYCDICKKTFSSKNAYIQHEQSKKHLKGLKEQGNSPLSEKSESGCSTPKEYVEKPKKVDNPEEDSENEFSPEDYEFDACRCLFCGEISDSMDEYLLFFMFTVVTWSI